MLGMGFSLNNLSLFGLVLAIGIVVDDAIVVVEAVEHHLEHGLSPKEAAVKAMNEVSGPIIAISLVLNVRVHTVRLYHRNYRPILSPVCTHDRSLDILLGGEFIDA